MSLSLGFIVVLLLIIFPGLIYRRFYFYGEFSKEFKSNINLVTLISISVIPGLINLIVVYFLYNSFFDYNISLSHLTDVYKNISSQDYRFENSNISVKDFIESSIFSFMCFVYLSSFLSGITFGRLVRISNLDTKFKLLRFKNYWFYLFNGQHTNFTKMKHLKVENGEHLFTKADVLINSNDKTLLYSGIIVDYELLENDSNSLKNIILQNAKRYSSKDEKVKVTDIPGNIFVVDCTNMININLTYIYDKKESILSSKVPSLIELVFGLLILLLIPLSIFKFSFLDLRLYNYYFSLNWYQRIPAFFLIIQIIGLLNPFVKEQDEYTWVNWKTFLGKLVWVIFLVLLIWLLMKI